MFYSIKCRMYPNKSQREMLEKHFGCYRYVYNWGLAKKIEAYQTEKKRIDCFDLINMLPDLKKQEETKWLIEVDSQALIFALRVLDNNYTRFFKKISKFPKFKSRKNSEQSFKSPGARAISEDGKKIWFPKIGFIRLILTRKIDGKMKDITVTKTPTKKYFVSILVDSGKDLPQKPPALEETAIGIDLGIKTFATISTGEKVSNSMFLQRSLEKMRQESRRLSRKKKGSKNREKQRVCLARVHERTANQRKDFLHKLSTRLVRENQTICLEDLSVSEMLGWRAQSRRIQDASWRMFRNFLTYKCDWYGKNLKIIGRFDPSSKMCSCGAINHELTLDQRQWTCQFCGVTHDRDLLASQNIKKFAFHPQALAHERSLNDKDFVKIIKEDLHEKEFELILIEDRSKSEELISSVSLNSSTARTAESNACGEAPLGASLKQEESDLR